MHSKFTFVFWSKHRKNKLSTNSLRGETFAENIYRSMSSQQIINELLAQGQESLTPEVQDRMIDIINGE